LESLTDCISQDLDKEADGNALQAHYLYDSLRHIGVLWAHAAVVQPIWYYICSFLGTVDFSFDAHAEMANLQDTKSNEKLAVTRAEIQKKQQIVHEETAVEAVTSKSIKSQKDAKAKLESFSDVEDIFGRNMIAELEGRAPRGSSSLKPKSAFPGETPAEFVRRLAKSFDIKVDDKCEEHGGDKTKTQARREAREEAKAKRQQQADGEGAATL